MIRLNHLFLSLIILTIIMGQTIPPQYGMVDPRKLDNQEPDDQMDMQIISSSIPLEQTIDPNLYILGPGDKLGVDIISTSHMFFTITVSPTADVLIPSTGVINVNGLTINDAINRISMLIKEQYKNSKVHITLMEVRSYLVPITGAVYNPGHHKVVATQRLWSLLKNAEGLHPYANAEKVEILHKNGYSDMVSLKQYLEDGKLENNPMIREGDRIHIPFKASVPSFLIDKIHADEDVVWVTGFVHYPGSYKFTPGYTMTEYINLAGGVITQGSEKSAFITKVEDSNSTDSIEPGDKIIVPESFKSRMIGNASIMQTITAFASLYLTYIAATK